MKNSSLRRIFVTIAGLMFGICATEARLTIGDPAPKLHVAKWVQGDPVQDFDTNHIYIVEFWATWCGPCRAAIPHINDMAQKFKDNGIIVIGQDVWDQDEKVAPLMKTMGNQMTYRVALDDKSQETNGFMAANWLKAAEQRSIPATFIIDQRGRVAWMGSPYAVTPELLCELLHRYDTPRVRATFEKQKQEVEKWLKLSQSLNEAIQQKKWDDAASALAEIEKMLPQLRDNDYHNHVFGPLDKDAYAPIRLQIIAGQKK
jgi:thiol-disulfide isomerase/thioredoxin